MRRLATTAVSMAVTMASVCGLAACGGDGGGAGGQGSNGDVRAVDGPVGMGELNKVCDGDVALSSAPPYAGPAPHPIAVFSQQQGNDPTGPTFPVRLLQDLGPVERDDFLAPTAQAQLVACAGRDAHEATDVVCRFDLGGDERVSFFRASYRITVREARSGKVVATVPVNPAAAGCPTSVKVAWGGAEVFSAPTDRQFVSALTAFTSWDGTGAPPASAEPAGAPAPAGTPVVQGSVHLTTAPGVDPASPEMRAHLAFWDAFTGAQEGDLADLRTLRTRADGSFLGTLTTILEQDRGGPGRSRRGPLRLMVTGVSPGPEAGAVSVDSCLDETTRETFEQSLPTGQIGIWSRVRVNVSPDAAGGYLASGFADAPSGPCPPPAGRVG